MLAMNGQARAQEPQVASNAGKETNANASSNSAAAKPENTADSSVRNASPNPGDYDNRLGMQFLKHVAQDQKAVFLAPSNVRFEDMDWLVPLGGAAAAMFATDSEFSRHLSSSPTRIKYSKDLGNYGVASLVGVGGGLYLWGQITHDDHKSETGLLAGEAAIDSLALTYGIKYATRRDRPYQGTGQGQFWSGGDSFPSEHAAAAWSIASVIAHEYPGPLTSLLAYGMASAVSASRLTAKQHFPSDVLVGSAIGWFEGMYVYRKHHDPTIGGGEWQTYADVQDEKVGDRSSSFASPYVELDSWIYPDLDRLIALGYISDAILGMRPWTRRECARLVDEAQQNLQDAASMSDQAEQLVQTLQQEFAPELQTSGANDNKQARVESVYSRVTGISGPPLTDSFHFGQTIINDYGRPFAQGANEVAGFSSWASAGRFVVYVRGEYQEAPSIPALPETARQLPSIIDGQVPLEPAIINPQVNQFQLLDSYVSLNLNAWQFSFGKQSLWWGSGEGGPMMFSDNAVPLTMFRIDRVSPVTLPWILSLLGPLRAEFIVGRLSGHDFVFGASTGLIGQWGVPLNDQPFIVGPKLNFRPTPNFEFGVDYTRVTAGPGQPFTFHQFVESVVSLGNGAYGTSSDPGDIRSGVDFSYKPPLIRKWLTFYGDAFTEDEYSPLGYPRKSAFEGGIYLPRIVGFRKLDLRVEGGSTSPVDFPGCNGCFYQNGRFINSYTNQGNLMGTWLGRASEGEQVWSTYWVNSRDKIQFNYRHRKIDGQFSPGGGTVNDGGVRADFWLGTKTQVSGFLQYEKWNVPVLAPGVQSNITTSVEVTYWPHPLK